MTPLAIAASVTPLSADGEALDHDAVPALADFLVGAGVDGILALGTTGEGIMLDEAERQAAARAFHDAIAGRCRLLVHCGAQTTAASARLAADAADIGVDGVAAIAPPYYPLDERMLADHFAAVAEACAPTPFHVYVFTARSGYRVPPAVIARVADRCPNVAGLKVSESPWERFAEYLLDGLDAFVGPEPLIARGLGAGAAGAMSGLASCCPELVVRAVRTGREEDAARAGAHRAELQTLPFVAAAKEVLRLRGVPLTPGMRAPQRPLDAEERRRLHGIVAAADAAAPAEA
jgi:dihydrodipicolinate synthase/N-acetylneuraminate lyase